MEVEPEAASAGQREQVCEDLDLSRQLVIAESTATSSESAAASEGEQARKEQALAEQLPIAEDVPPPPPPKRDESRKDDEKDKGKQLKKSLSHGPNLRDKPAEERRPSDGELSKAGSRQAKRPDQRRPRITPLMEIDTSAAAAMLTPQPSPAFIAQPSQFARPVSSRDPVSSRWSLQPRRLCINNNRSCRMSWDIPYGSPCPRVTQCSFWACCATWC